jgi:hypothetical protein
MKTVFCRLDASTVPMTVMGRLLGVYLALLYRGDLPLALRATSASGPVYLVRQLY